MTEKDSRHEWSGFKGKLFAWHLDNPLARRLETLLLGDIMPSFLNEFSRMIRGDEVVLDVGCGTGRFSLEMAKRLSTGKVICLDVSEVMLGSLERKAEKQNLRDRVSLLKAEASSTGLEDQSVDLAVSNSVLHELPEPGVALSEIFRVMKPGGRIVMTDFGRTLIGKWISSHGKDAHGPFNVVELEALLARTGFKDLKVTAIRSFLLGVGRK